MRGIPRWMPTWGHMGSSIGLQDHRGTSALLACDPLPTMTKIRPGRWRHRPHFHHCIIPSCGGRARLLQDQRAAMQVKHLYVAWGEVCT